MVWVMEANTFRCSGGRRFAHDALGWRLVALRDAQVDDEGQDAAEEDVARPGRPETQTAVLVAPLGHLVADRRAQRPGHDVGEPERQHGVDLQDVVREGDDPDGPAEDEDRQRVADVEPLGDQVAGRGAQREREEDRQPVEGLAARRHDRVDRERPFDGVPDGEHEREDAGEDRRARREGHVARVGQVVGDERAEHADHDDDRPVHDRHVSPETELDEQEHGEQRSGDVRRVGEPEAEVDVQVVRGGLADGGAHDLDHPEPEGDLGDLVEHRPPELTSGDGVGGGHGAQRCGPQPCTFLTGRRGSSTRPDARRVHVAVRKRAASWPP
jgi:hypothetical protein